MFSLSDTDLQGSLLGCGDGPASFNAELAASGKSQRLVSVDPLYLFAGSEITARVEQTYETIISHVERNHDRYVWTYFKDPRALGAARLNAIKIFLDDYEAGRAEGRYLVVDVPYIFQKGGGQMLRVARRGQSIERDPEPRKTSG
jgi:hypothetical protein